MEPKGKSCSFPVCTGILTRRRRHTFGRQEQRSSRLGAKSPLTSCNQLENEAHNEPYALHHRCMTPAEHWPSAIGHLCIGLLLILPCAQSRAQVQYENLADSQALGSTLGANGGGIGGGVAWLDYDNDGDPI